MNNFPKKIKIKDVTVTVSGISGAGKTYVIALLTRALQDYGDKINVSYKGLTKQQLDMAYFNVGVAKVEATIDIIEKLQLRRGLNENKAKNIRPKKKCTQKLL